MQYADNVPNTARSLPTRSWAFEADHLEFNQEVQTNVQTTSGSDQIKTKIAPGRRFTLNEVLKF